MNIRKVALSTLLALCFLGGTAYGAWLGPDNYEECVLEKMKGQPKNMKGIAMVACEKKFPYEKEIFINEEVNINWLSADEGEFKMRVDENFSKYNITRSMHEFSKKTCENIQKSDFTLTKIFVFPKSTSSSRPVSIKNSSEYKCSRLTRLWGMMK